MQRTCRGIGCHQVQRLTHRHADGSSDVLGDDTDCQEGHSAEKQHDDDEGCPARNADIACQSFDENYESYDDTDKCSEHADKRHKPEWSGTEADYETPEVGHELAVRIPGAVVKALSREDRTIRNTPKCPTECDIKEYTWPHISGDAPSDFAEHESEAAETTEASIRKQTRGDYLGRTRGQIPKETMWWGVSRNPVYQRCTVLKCDIEHPPKVSGIELAVLVHRDYPLGARRGHASDRGRVLSKVP